MLFLQWIETVGGIWLAMSAIAFIFAAVLVKTRQESADSVVSTNHLSEDVGPRRLDRARTAKKKPSDKDSAPLEKAA